MAVKNESVTGVNLVFTILHPNNQINNIIFFVKNVKHNTFLNVGLLENTPNESNYSSSWRRCQA